jgi:2,4-dienoyl-CoA reductase-like NADH-dependent reductase (Old Yellow Enzyme family)
MGDLTLKNRVILAPMTRARAGKERLPNDLMATYYQQRSNAGLVLTEATTISSQANGWNESPGIYSDEMMKGWMKTTQAVHETGGIVFLQLWHCGRASHSAFHGGDLPVAPSAIKLNGDYVHTPEGKKDYETPRALETDELPGLIADYKRAAERAKEAGFDGVELHCANGYLLDEFLQSKTNHRTDEYGGSKENRFRLIREVLEALLTVWPANRVGVRLSPNGAFNDMGSEDYREMFPYYMQELDKFKLGYLHVMDGLAFGFHELGDPMTLKEVREVYSGLIMGNCGYDQAEAEKRIADGDADMISFGRPYISNPDLAERFKNDWPLADEADVSVWYAGGGEKGYTDFPAYSAG